MFEFRDEQNLEKIVLDTQKYVKSVVSKEKADSALQYFKSVDEDPAKQDKKNKERVDPPQKEHDEKPVKPVSQSSGVRYSRRIETDDLSQAVSERDRFNIQTVADSFGKLDLLNSARNISLGKLGITKDLSFSDRMIEYINSKGLKESDVYKAAGIDRRLFSKIISSNNYKPSKDTCIALAFALKLSFVQADDLLQRAGFGFSHSDERDITLEYLFRRGLHKVDDVNWILVKMGLKPLGRQDAY